MATRTFSVAVPTNFQLRTIVFSHGWYDLPPIRWNDPQRVLSWVARTGGPPEAIAIEQPRPGELSVRVAAVGRWTSSRQAAAESHVRRVLGCDFDAEPFFRQAGKEYAWARKIGAGPLLRGASVFEDAVKMLATTNCSWSLTRQMVARLIDALGEPAPNGEKAFPTPAAMAKQSAAFYRDVVRAGYRSEYFRDFARQVADGALDPESWDRFDGTTTELLKTITAVKGFGRYAAENLCRLLGRFDGLALDSWCVKKIAQARPELTGDPTKAMRDFYAKFGPWQGLALWLDLTKDWHEERARKDRAAGFTKQSRAKTPRFTS